MNRGQQDRYGPGDEAPVGFCGGYSPYEPESRIGRTHGQRAPLPGFVPWRQAGIRLAVHLTAVPVRMLVPREHRKGRGAHVMAKNDSAGGERRGHVSDGHEDTHGQQRKQRAQHLRSPS